MVPGPIRLYKSTGSDRVAVVSTEPAPGGFLVRLTRQGPKASDKVIGPYHPSELPERFAEVVDGLKSEGYGPPGLAALLDALQGPDVAARARAALRLGWRKESDAVPTILGLLPQAVDEVCSLLDALGAIGDPRAIPSLRDYATRKLLSRRRSAVEALRAIGDAAGLAEATARALEQLPEPVRAAIESPDDAAQAILGLEPQRQGLALDTLYETGLPAAPLAVRNALDAMEIDKPYLWRYVKSIYKRSMLRHDAETFGRLARSIEARGRLSQGTNAAVKSGYDGVQRQTPIFQRKTRDYLRRLGWRYLSNLAKHRPALYADAAASVVAAYQPEDPEEPDGFRGAFARCYLWHRVLLGRSTRFHFDDRRLVFRFRDAKSTQPVEGAREESWPDLWDAHPSAYVHILKTARLPEAHAFAVRAIQARHVHILESLSQDDLIALLTAPYPETGALGLAELDRRFDPSRPDLAILDRVLSCDVPQARELGRRWLRLAAPLWTSDQEWVLIFLAFPDAETASLAGELAARSLRDHPAMRRALAARLLDRLRAPEPSPGAHDVYARLAGDALAEETSALLSVPDLVLLCETGSPPLQALAGKLLSHRPEAVAHLGAEGLVELAGHEIADVRLAAHGLIRSNVERFRSDPSPLFLLVESDWHDTRSLAFELLRDRLGFDVLGFEGLVGLLDSNRPDVREVGRSLARTHADRLDLRTLARRMVEHPAPDARRFALDLAVDHLPDGDQALRDLSWFLRSALLELHPDRLLKRRVVDFLLTRGRRDPHQAEVAARLLADASRMAVRSDAEHAREALARLALAWPDLRLPEGVLVGEEALA
ncbi:MAG: HEAT repeat domain-containing protein [Isosphaeraceae bacterium]